MIKSRSIIGDKVTPSEQKTAKIGAVIRTLESLLYEVTIHGSTTDQDLLRSAIEEYYSQIIDGPADQLVRVRYLVHQGKRRTALDLVNQYWEDTRPELLLTACGALLNVEDTLADINKLELTPQFTLENRKKLDGGR